MNKDLISVIVPIYNVEQYLERCVDSICQQTYQELEIILVDDGAKDSCPQMCDSFAKKDPRIVVIHKPNGGLSDARNAGIEKASGDFLLFVDADDYIAPEMCEVLLSAVKNSRADLSICNFLCVGELSDSFIRFNQALPFQNETISGADNIEMRILGSQKWYWVVAWNKLYRKELFEKIRYPKGKLHEDEFVFHEIFMQCSRVACVKDVLYYYEQRVGSITQSPFKVQRLDGVEAYFRRADELIQAGYHSNCIETALFNGLDTLFHIFINELADDSEYRSRYLELVSQFRNLGLLRIFKNVFGLKKRAFFLLAFISTHLAWKLKSFMEIT